MTDREMMEMALEYLIEFGMGEMPTAKALRNRLAQPEQNLDHSIEVRCFGSTVTFTTRELLSKYKNGDRFYRIPPPKREWVGLDIDEIYDMSQKIKQFCTNDLDQMSLDKYAGAFAVAIEAKLKEKNT